MAVTNGCQAEQSNEDGKGDSDGHVDGDIINQVCYSDPLSRYELTSVVVTGGPAASLRCHQSHRQGIGKWQGGEDSGSIERRLSCGPSRNIADTLRMCYVGDGKALCTGRGFLQSTGLEADQVG